MSKIFTKGDIQGSPIVLMDGYPMTIDRIIDLLNEPDVIKRRWAKEITEAENYCQNSGYTCPFSCEGFADGTQNGVKHSTDCVVTGAKQYLEGLEAE